MKKLKKSVVALLAIIIATLGISSVASAASLNGVSANTTMANYYVSKGDNVKLVVKNDNTYDTMSTITPQKYVNGTWVDFDWWDSSVLDPNQSETLSYTIGSGKQFPVGTYRFVIESAGGPNSIDLGKFNTGTFVVHN